jgi:hypothetical protein
MRYDHSKHRWVFTNRHDVTSQKTWVSYNTSVRASNLVLSPRLPGQTEQKKTTRTPQHSLFRNEIWTRDQSNKKQESQLFYRDVCPLSLVNKLCEEMIQAWRKFLTVGLCAFPSLQSVKKACSGYSNSLRAERSGIRVPVGPRHFSLL